MTTKKRGRQEKLLVWRPCGKEGQPSFHRVASILSMTTAAACICLGLDLWLTKMTGAGQTQHQEKFILEPGVVEIQGLR
jgi:hypothetical protein